MIEDVREALYEGAMLIAGDLLSFAVRELRRRTKGPVSRRKPALSELSDGQLERLAALKKRIEN